jgi:hypothetical protein
MVLGYRHELVNRYHNYFFTPERWKWLGTPKTPVCVVDGFSPNLNKTLHVGHLRNLALANSLSKMLGTDSRFVALLGKSLGTLDGAKDSLDKWFNWLNYAPEVYYDTDFSGDVSQLTLMARETTWAARYTKVQRDQL